VGGSVPLVPERIKGSRRTAAVPSWRYRDLQQRAAAGLAIGGRPLCPFYLGGRGGRLRHGLLSGCPSVAYRGPLVACFARKLVCAPITGGAQSWICRSRIVIRGLP
jgi:hypothetical protein